MDNVTQLREVFHFCFLERLLKLSDPNMFVLKGGVNLRFFFNSPRYSEDMDLDVLAGSVTTLKKNGFKILEDSAFKRSLRVYGIADLDINDPQKAKHTETTQRFRVGLLTPGGVRLPTKVEFSRRNSKAENTEIEMIDLEIARRYRKLSFRCRHYTGEIAVVHKINALCGRAVTQARDVFDLGILYQGGYVTTELLHRNFDAAQRETAMAHLSGLTFDDYAGQVLEFLDEPSKAQYGGESAWLDLQAMLLTILSSDA